MDKDQDRGRRGPEGDTGGDREFEIEPLAKEEDDTRPDDEKDTDGNIPVPNLE